MLRTLFVSTKHGDESRISDVTELQLVHAIGASLLGIVSAEDQVALGNNVLSYLSIESQDAKEEVKNRIFELFAMIKQYWIQCQRKQPKH